MRRHHLLLACLCIALVAGPALADAGSTPVGTLGGEDPRSVFWETPVIVCDGQRSAAAISAAPPCDDGLVFAYTLDVAEPGLLLRVDFDHPYRQDAFRLDVTTPAGTTVTRSTHNTYSEGVQVPNAPAGTYTVKLTPTRTAGSAVRLRAGLVSPAAPLAADEELLPNLRVTPPFEFGFVAPINPANSMFLAGDDQNPAIIVAGQQPVSCTADEVQEASDPTRNAEPTVLTRCLRFTTGPHNIGAGHMDLRFPIADRAIEDQDRLIEMTQVIQHGDGSTTERPAGTYEYHATHGHWHYKDILFYELLAADPQARTVTRVGVGHKSGFCPADQGYGNWHAFDQQPQGELGSTQEGDCFALSGNGAMGLTAGWGDFYRWQRPGQFVDFSGQPDGLYVVRGTVDVHDNVLETNEEDNASYAYLRIEGDDIEILERGYGASPYDPAKVMATDNRGMYPTAGLAEARDFSPR